MTTGIIYTTPDGSIYDVHKGPTICDWCERPAPCVIVIPDRQDPIYQRHRDGVLGVCLRCRESTDVAVDGRFEREVRHPDDNCDDRIIIGPTTDLDRVTLAHPRRLRADRAADRLAAGIEHDLPDDVLDRLRREARREHALLVRAARRDLNRAASLRGPRSTRPLASRPRSKRPQARRPRRHSSGSDDGDGEPPRAARARSDDDGHHDHDDDVARHREVRP